MLHGHIADLRQALEAERSRVIGGEQELARAQASERAALASLADLELRLAAETARAEKVLAQFEAEQRMHADLQARVQEAVEAERSTRDRLAAAFTQVEILQAQAETADRKAAEVAKALEVARTASAVAQVELENLRQAEQERRNRGLLARVAAAFLRA